MGFGELLRSTAHLYPLRSARRALIRDLNYLIGLEVLALGLEGGPAGESWIGVNLEWPTQISETEFFRRARELPRGRTLRFLARS